MSALSFSLGLLLLSCAPSVSASVGVFSQSGDTLLVADTPYCLAFRNQNELVLRSWDYEKVLQLQMVHIGGNQYLELSIPPFNRTYYLDTNRLFFDKVLTDCVQEQIFENGYFSAYGANKLVIRYRKHYPLFESWEMPVQNQRQETPDWNITWKATSNKDSTLIIVNGKPFGYYMQRHWDDYGVDKWQVLKNTQASYRYFIYDFSNRLLAEVRVADWWKTGVRIIMPGNEEYTIRDVPKNSDYMTVVAKLILLRQKEKK